MLTLLMVFQAFIDDSYDAGGVFILGGHIATAEAWANFSDEWETALEWGVLDADGKRHFKMSEMAQSEERMSRVPLFCRIIDDHVLLSVSCKINQADIAAAKLRLWTPGVNIEWGYIDNPFLLSFRLLLDLFHNNREKIARMVPSDKKIDFIFDNHSEQRAVLDGWDTYINSRSSDIRNLFGATPRFEDDKEFLPLQAADWWAWCVRRWYAEGVERVRMPDPICGKWRTQRKPWPQLAISFGEDDIVRYLREVLNFYAPNRIIYDIKFSGISWR